jgi:hypothetical protein
VSDERDRAASTVDAFRLACVREEGVAVLGTLTDSQRERFLQAPSVLQGCAQVAGIDAGDDATIRDDLAGARIEDVSTDGDVGSATLAGAGGARREVELEWSSPGWLVHAAVGR